MTHHPWWQSTAWRCSACLREYPAGAAPVYSWSQSKDGATWEHHQYCQDCAQPAGIYYA